ncbi:hypothetical protein [Actinophytocola sp.]|uniref:hypothetical protein n=1 Tax=Actinophytocola sp. TaxID=1872138 RepID=UPI003D6A5B28
MYIDTDPEDSGGSGRMLVDPSRLMQLKQGIEEEADRVRRWLFTNGDRLRFIEPPGGDPCSKDTMNLMGQNGSSALDMADAYVARLSVVADKLGESGRTYGQVEDKTTDEFRRGPE